MSLFKSLQCFGVLTKECILGESLCARFSTSRNNLSSLEAGLEPMCVLIFPLIQCLRFQFCLRKARHKRTKGSWEVCFWGFNELTQSPRCSLFSGILISPRTQVPPLMSLGYVVRDRKATEEKIIVGEPKEEYLLQNLPTFLSKSSEKFENCWNWPDPRARGSFVYKSETQ